jgi:hypothetical protein
MKIHSLLALLLLTNLWFTNTWLPEVSGHHDGGAMIELSMSSNHDCCDADTEVIQSDCLSHCYQVSTLSAYGHEVKAVVTHPLGLMSNSNLLINPPVSELFRPPIT